MMPLAEDGEWTCMAGRTCMAGPARRNWGYLAIETLGADATATPLAAPAATIRVADLLP